MIQFELGRVVVTRAAFDVVPRAKLLACLQRHVSGDWGVCDVEDKHANDRSVEMGYRILSAYQIDDSEPSAGYGKNTVWVITEADRSSTTILLPEE